MLGIGWPGARDRLPLPLSSWLEPDNFHDRQDPKQWQFAEKGTPACPSLTLQKVGVNYGLGKIDLEAFMKTPERTTAEVFPRYLGGEVVADSATLKWTGLIARRYRFPRVIDGFLVPVTAEPLIACVIAGSAEFEEREIGGAWLPRRVRRGDLFVTGSTSPYGLRWNSPLGAELEVVHIHLAVDQLTAALETVYQYKAAAVEVSEFFWPR
jgi:hypothetical protein